MYRSRLFVRPFVELKKKLNDFLFSFTVSISSKLRTKHPWFKRFMFYQMKGQTFQWGIILTKTLFGQRGSVMGYGQFDMEINRQQMTVISQVKKRSNLNVRNFFKFVNILTLGARKGSKCGYGVFLKKFGRN